MKEKHNDMLRTQSSPFLAHAHPGACVLTRLTALPLPWPPPCPHPSYCRQQHGPVKFRDQLIEPSGWGSSVEQQVKPGQRQ